MATITNNALIINTDYQFAKLIDGSITNAVIPFGVSETRAYACNSTALEKIVIPKSVKKLNYKSFLNCSKLKEVVLEDDGLNSIDTHCFEGCSALQTFRFPIGLKIIGNNAFIGCTGLKEIEFADAGVSSIGEGVFNGCTLLEEIKFPIGLSTVGYRAFYGCSALRKVSLSATITTVSRSIFENCSSLSYVFFRGNTPITSGIQGLFTSCNNIRLFDMRYMLSAKDKGSQYTFTANNVYLYINVPDSLYTEFTALPNWSALNLKRWVHSCDVATFEEIQNPIDGDYYSLKGDTNYLNPLGEKQIDIRQYTNGSWVEVDIG